MPCDIFRWGDGAGIICSRGRRPNGKPCFAQCPLPAYWQCDYETQPGKTCDRNICERHRRGVGPDRDYCLEHFYVDRKKREEAGDGSQQR